MPTNVKCVGCGYLSIRNQQTRQLMEVETEIRCGGQFPEAYEMRPICFRMEEQFEQSLIELENRPDLDEMNNRDQFDEIIEQPRTCESFTTWKQGWTPKEHLEMMVTEKSLTEQRVWQAEQSRLADKRHSQQMWIAALHPTLPSRTYYLDQWGIH